MLWRRELGRVTREGSRSYTTRPDAATYHAHTVPIQTSYAGAVPKSHTHAPSDITIPGAL